MSALFRRKPVSGLVFEAGSTHLHRALGKWDLTGLGIGAIIGAGIFAATGSAIAGGGSHLGAGPGIVLSMLLTGLACGFAALCYAEFAAMVPVSGSAYTYAYAALGELIAWIIGWDLIIEYAVGNVAVAISWSGYFVELVRHIGIHIPAWLATDFRTAVQSAAAVAGGAAEPATRYLASAMDAPRILGVPLVFNLPAVAIVAAITVLLVRGVRETSRFNAIIVAVKLVIVLFFIGVGALFVRPSNYTAHGGFLPNGFKGVGAASAIIFFAYIGFDAVSTASEEAKDPGRDMPFGIIMSLVVCTVIYILVALVMTGMAPWDRLGTADPMLTALALSGGSERLVSVSSFIVAFGAVIAMTSVLLVFQLGQPRIFFSMARDGLLPAWARKVHPRFRTPHVTTILTGVFVAVFAAFANINEAVELTNIGTLFAFVLVSIGVLVLRRSEPDRERPFRAPWMPWTALVAAATCLYLMSRLPGVTWARFAIWLAIGLPIYFLYGRRRSVLAGRTEADG